MVKYLIKVCLISAFYSSLVYVVVALVIIAFEKEKNKKLLIEDFEKRIFILEMKDKEEAEKRIFKFEEETDKKEFD